MTVYPTYRYMRTLANVKDRDGDTGHDFGAAAGGKRWSFRNHRWNEYGGNIYDSSFQRKFTAADWEAYTLSTFTQFTESSNRYEPDPAKWKAVGVVGVRKLFIVGALYSTPGAAPSGDFILED